MPRTLKEELIQILLDSNLLTTEQLDEALKIQKEKKLKLRDILISQGYVNQRDLMAALSQKLDIPPISLSKIKINKDVVKLIPEEISRHYLLMPVSKIGKTLTIAMADPLNVFAIDDLKTLTNFIIKPIISNEDEIKNSIETYYSQIKDNKFEKILKEMDKDTLKTLDEEQKDEEIDTEALLKRIDEKPIVNLTNLILIEAIKRKASDILIEPQEKRTTVRYRVDGVLQESPQIPKALHNTIVSRIKVMSNLNIAEHRLPQDGRFKAKVLNRNVDYRVSILPTSFGEKVALRVLDKSSLALDVDKLGFEESVLGSLKENAKRPHGMILVCGPTGCGKTTTLYSVLKFVDSPTKNIVTIEDPVEYELEGINQATSLPGVGLTFASALRSILRQDPDIIMVGEIRDFDTVDIAIKAALTGHLVLSTLHTTTAAGSVIRLIDMGVEPFLITSSCLIFIAQKLVRKICPNCKRPYKINDNVRRSLKLETLERELKMKIGEFYHGEGCQKCQKTGYISRVAVGEALVLSDAVKDLIIKRVPEADIARQAQLEGMKTVRENGLLKAIKGITTLEEVLRVSVD